MAKRRRGSPRGGRGSSSSRSPRPGKPSTGKCSHTNNVKVGKVKDAVEDLVYAMNKRAKKGGQGKQPQLLCLHCGYIGYSNSQKPFAHFVSKHCIAARLSLGRCTPHCFKCEMDLTPSNSTQNIPFKRVSTELEKLVKHGIADGAASAGDAKMAAKTQSTGDEPPAETSPPADQKVEAKEDASGVESKKYKPAKQSNNGVQLDVPSLPPRGLSNLGNTCFFNSVMQNLTATAPLRSRIISAAREAKGASKPAPLRSAMRAFMAEMGRGRGAFSPGNVFSAVCKYHGKFRGGRQHDSHELLRCLLDSLREENKRVVVITPEGRSVVEQVSTWTYDEVLNWVDSLGLTGWETFRDLAQSHEKARAELAAVPKDGASNGQEPWKVVGKKGKNTTPLALDGTFVRTMLERPKHKPMLRLLKKLVPEREDRKKFGAAVRLMRKGRMPGDPEPIVDVGDEKKAKEAAERAERERNPIDAVFGFHTLSCVQCLECKGVSLRDEPNLDIPVTISPPAGLGGGGRRGGAGSGSRMTKRQRKALAKYKQRQRRAQQRRGGSSGGGGSPSPGPVGTDTDPYKNLSRKQRKALFRKEREAKKKAKREAEEMAKRQSAANGTATADAAETESKSAAKSDETKSIGNEQDISSDKPNDALSKPSENGQDAADTKGASQDGSKDGSKDGSPESDTPKQTDKPQQTQSSDPRMWTVVFRDGLNVRAEPNAEAKVVGAVEFKDEILAIEEREGWVRHTKGWTLGSDAIGTLYMKRTKDVVPEDLVEPSAATTSSGDPQDEDESDSQDAETDAAFDVLEAFFPVGSNAPIEHVKGCKELLSGKSPSLTDCLRVFTASETLGGDYICVKCTEKKGDIVRTNARKRTLVKTLPRVLTVQLKRFAATARGTFAKIGKHVRFPLQLDMRPFLVDRRSGATDGGSTLYGLYGIVSHSGGMGGGHYVAYTRKGPDRWYYFSDRTATSVTEQSVLGKQAYICFYQRLDV